MFMRDCTFLPSQNHGHGAAKAVRPMAALPHPLHQLCSSICAAPNVVAPVSSEEHRSRERIKQFRRRFLRATSTSSGCCRRQSAAALRAMRGSAVFFGPNGEYVTLRFVVRFLKLRNLVLYFRNTPIATFTPP